MTYFTSLFLTVATGFCSGHTTAGQAYKDYIHAATAVYQNALTYEQHWNGEVTRGIGAFKAAGTCPAK